MTQRELGEFLGLTSQQISNYETGRQPIPRVVVQAITSLAPRKVSKYSGLSVEEKKFLEQFVAQLREKTGQDILFLVAFGSKIRGEGQKDSDLDLLVVVQKKTPKLREQIFRILFELDPINRYSLSPILYSLYEFRMNERMNSPFILNLKKEGALL